MLWKAAATTLCMPCMWVCMHPMHMRVQPPGSGPTAIPQSMTPLAPCISLVSHGCAFFRISHAKYKVTSLDSIYTMPEHKTPSVEMERLSLHASDVQTGSKKQMSSDEIALERAQQKRAEQQARRSAVCLPSFGTGTHCCSTLLHLMKHTCLTFMGYCVFAHGWFQYPTTDDPPSCYT